MEIVGGSVARAPDLVVVKRPLQLVANMLQPVYPPLVDSFPSCCRCIRSGPRSPAERLKMQVHFLCLPLTNSRINLQHLCCS